MNDEVRPRNVVDADEYLKVVVENKILKQHILELKDQVEKDIVRLSQDIQNNGYVYDLQDYLKYLELKGYL